MQSEHNNIGWRFWGRWVLATTIGWSAGIIIAFIVAHLIAPIAYIAIPNETNLVVGLCLGAVVGYMQRRFAPTCTRPADRLTYPVRILFRPRNFHSSLHGFEVD